MFVVRNAQQDFKSWQSDLEASFPSQGVDVRLSLAIGNVDFELPNLAASDGEAYQLSGRNLDALKHSHSKIAIASADAHNAYLQVYGIMLDAIFNKASHAQCQAMLIKLGSKTDTEIAKKLGVSQAAISHRLKGGNWHAINALRQHYETLCNIATIAKRNA